MAFQPLRLPLDVCPVEGELVDMDLGADIVGEIVELVAVQDRKRGGPHGLERGGGGYLVRGEQLQDLPDFGQIGIALQALRGDLLLGRRFGVLDGLGDGVDKAGQQMIVALVIAMGDEAEQVEIDQPGVELPEAEDRIIADQRGIVFDAFIGNLQLRHDTFRQLIERAQLIATADFLAHFTQTEILGLVLEPRQRIQAIGISEQGIEGGAFVRCQVCLHQGDQPLLFLHQRLADQLL